MGKILNNTEKQKKFVEIFKNDVSPYLKGYEVLRKRLYKEVIFKKIIPNTIFFAIYTSCIFYIAFSQHIALAIICILFTIPFLATLIPNFNYKTNEKINAFKLNLKKDFLIKIIKAFGDIRWVNKVKIFEESELEKSGLFASFNQENIDDCFFGKHKDIDFKVCEIKMLNFKGIILEFNQNKKVETRAVISTKRDLIGRDSYKIGMVVFGIILVPILFGFFEYLFSGLGFLSIIPQMYDSINPTGNFVAFLTLTCAGIIFFSIAIIIFGFLIRIFVFAIKEYSKELKKQEQIILEDVKFEKKFHVHSENQIEARCIVTPAFIEKFLNLKIAFKSNKVKCSFYDDKIMFAISTKKNLFEIGYINRNLLEPKNFKNLFDEINAIYDIIEYFNSDKKL
ncbi:MAG: DUF3137 domain-containing protein [Cyanobacteria bacterium SIG27]|nr:DUF3137 domain-containing protein [Cyanobacteria bacterium SIG27]